VSRVELPPWRPGRRRLLLPLVWALVRVPAAVVRGYRSGRVFVDAISFAPFEERYRWRTTPERARRVLIQVEGQLARGERPEPADGELLR
jgi:hypothetical protein